MSVPRLRFLGPPQAEYEGTTVDLGSSKALALLAYLAAGHTPRSREQLLALLWPDSSADAARKTLRNRLWTIRKTLGGDVLAVEGDQLALATQVWTDVRDFESVAASDDPSKLEHLKSKIALVRGPFLDGFTLDDAPDFEIWMVSERERYGQLHLRLFAQLAEAHRAAADWAALRETAEQALTHDSLQEPMHRALMEAYARMGDRLAALRQYETLRTVLERELGVEPLAESKQLRAHIAAGRMQPSEIRTFAAAPLARGTRALASETPFIGRQTELDILDSEFRTASAGEPRLVLLDGEVGIGKTRTWREWIRRRGGDFLMLETRCLESTRALPFAPLMLLFQSQAAAARLFAPDSALSPIWFPDVARLIPEARALLDEPSGAQSPRSILSVPSEPERLRILEAFTQCVIALSRQPLVIGIDDLHWADSATLDWLDYLLHRRLQQPVLLVATNRSEDTTPLLRDRITVWVREGLTRRQTLSRLNDDESARLIASLLGSTPTVAEMQIQSAGNPLFLIELCRAAPGDVPALLAELIRARLDHLPEAARQVAQAAAVLEGYGDFNSLRRTSGRGEEETLDALDALLHAGVLVERERRYDFAHPLVGTIVRSGLSGARRAFLHRRAAEALEVTYGARVTEVAGPLAAHFEQAGDPVQAAKYAEMAGERALMLGAASEAAASFRLALANQPSPARHLGLGNALLALNEVALALASYLTAFDAYVAQGDRRGTARACISLANYYTRFGRTADVIVWAEKSRLYIDAASDPEALAYAYAMLGVGRVRGERVLGETEMHLREALRIAEEHCLGEIETRARLTLGNLAAQRGDIRSAVQEYEAALVVARSSRDLFMEVICENNVAYHRLLLNDLPAARTHVDSGLKLAGARALRLPLPWLYSTRGELAMAEQQWEDAATWFQRGLDEALALGNMEQQANGRMNLGRVAQARGQLAEALALLSEAREEAGRLAASYLQTRIDLFLVEIHLARGDQNAAEATLNRAAAALREGEWAQLQEWAVRLHESLGTRT